jgi:hypothetical protein
MKRNMRFMIQDTSTVNGAVSNYFKMNLIMNRHESYRLPGVIQQKVYAGIFT